VFVVCPLLRQLRSVRHSLPRHALLTLVCALVVFKVDYCISVLAGISWSLQNRLQLVLNATARLVCLARKSERIPPFLRELHWLRVPECIQFRLCVWAYRCMHGTAPCLSSRQPAADCRRTCTPSSVLYKHHDTAGAIDTTFFDRQPGISSGGSSSLEEFATSDKSHQLTAAVSDRDKSTSVLTIILWLIGSHCCLSRTADSLTLQRSTRFA